MNTTNNTRPNVQKLADRLNASSPELRRTFIRLIKSGLIKDMMPTAPYTDK